MRILFLTQIVPYPPDAGPRIKTWNVLRYLSYRGNEITLVTFIRDDERGNLAPLSEICAQVHTIPIHRSRMADIGFLLRSIVDGRPFLVERDDISGLRSLIRQLLKKNSFDCIHADQLTMTQFALPVAGQDGSQATWLNAPQNGIGGKLASSPLIFDAHNAVWTVVERMAENSPWFLKPLLGLEARRVKRYEAEIVHSFDCTLAVSELDRQAFLKALSAAGRDAPSTSEKITVIPIAVDTGQLEPISHQPNSLNIMTMGTLNYPPNADGIRWFMKEIFPLIREQVPEATLTVIGKNPPKDFLERVSQEPRCIKVTGYVPDLTPYLEQAAIMAVPVRAGGGMRVRILEAFARAIPVVTTTVGLEGIDARPGEDVLVADTPADFAAAAVRLLQDESLRSRLAANGRHLAEQRYDWKVVLKELDTVYDRIEKQSAVPATESSF